MNNLFIKPIKDSDTYKYLSIDKNVTCVGAVNKERVTKEYYTRVKKIGKQNFHLSTKLLLTIYLPYLYWQPQFE